MPPIDNTSGRRWARGALAFGAVISVTGNEAHTVLTASTVGIVLRVVLACVWPLALFVAIEVLVRVNWRAKFIDHAGRTVMLVPVGMVAAVVSYQHLHGLMTLGGEDAFSAAIGPLAIDGLMIGGTVALLAIRAASLATPETETAPALPPVTVPLMAAAQPESAPIVEPVPSEALLLPMPVSPAPAMEQAKRARARATSADQEKAVLLLLEGRPATEVAKLVGAGVSTVGRWAKQVRTLRADRNAVIDTAAERVSPELIAYIREQVTR
jgi:hypothetical protein